MPVFIISEKSKDYRIFSFTGSITVGRSKENNIVLNTSFVSRIHAHVNLEDGRYIVYDNNSMNGILFRNRKIEKLILKQGDSFQISDYSFTFIEHENSVSVENKISDIIQIKENQYDDGSTTVFSKFERKPDGKFFHMDDHSDHQVIQIDRKDRFAQIMNFISEIVSILDYYELMEKALNMSLEITKAKRGFLALRDEKTGDLVYKIKKGFGNNKKFEVSYQIIKKAMKESRTVSTGNAVKDLPSESVYAFDLKSVICTPMVGRDDVIGCMYIDNPCRAENFTPEDRLLMKILSRYISIAIENTALYKKISDERADLKNQLALTEDIIVESENMVKLYEDVKKFAKFNVNVLILGETGTGKELVARSIHKFSERKGEFIGVNCSAIPENLLESELFGYEKGAHSSAQCRKAGMFEIAKGGTIFLDEIGDMNISLQPKLLRVLQEKEFTPVGSTKILKTDVRVVAATNKNLEEMIKERKFREDLYYRLSGAILKTYPLRERKKDILPLARFLLLKFAEENKCKIPDISDKAVEILKTYDWPGNINELKQVIHGCAIRNRGATIYPEDMPEKLKEISPKIVQENLFSMEEMEKRHIHSVLQYTKDNKKEAAKILKISRAQLYAKIKKYGIET